MYFFQPGVDCGAVSFHTRRKKKYESFLIGRSIWSWRQFSLLFWSQRKFGGLIIKRKYRSYSFRFERNSESISVSVGLFFWGNFFCFYFCVASSIGYLFLERAESGATSGSDILAYIMENILRGIFCEILCRICGQLSLVNYIVKHILKKCC